MTVIAIPEGQEGITPYLCVDDGAAAIDFYTKVLGGVETLRMDAPGGKIGHAELTVGKSKIMLSDEYEEMGVLSPKTIGGSPVTLSLYVEDVDAVAARFLEHGGRTMRPVANQFYGDRSGQFLDPFGHRWNIATHIEDVSHEEMQRRAKELYGA
jgi:PhnB protein